MARFIGLGEETTFRTAVAAAKYIDVREERITEDRQYVYVATGGARGTRIALPGGHKVGGDFSFIARADNLGLLLKAMFGQVSTTADDATSPVAYRHEFTPAFSVPSLTVEVSPEVGGTSRQISGSLVNSLAFEAVAREPLAVTATIIGSKSATIATTTPTWPTVRPFMFFEGSLTLAGTSVADVRAFRCTLEQEIPDDAFVLGDMFLPDNRTLLGQFKASGDLDVVFKSWSLYRRFWGSSTATEPLTAPASVAMRLTFTGPSTGSTVSGFENYKLEIDLPTVRLDTSEANFSGREPIVQRLGWTATFEDAHVAEATLINTESSI